MTPEMILIIILVVALAVCGLGWANAEAHKQALDAVCTTLAREKGELSFELDRAKAAIKATPVGPRFAWDPNDDCWVLKDCIRIDYDVIQSVYPKFQLYINKSLRYKKEEGGKPSAENLTNNDKNP